MIPVATLPGRMKGRHVVRRIIVRIIQVRVLAQDQTMHKEQDGLVLEAEPRQRMALRLLLLNPRLKPNVLTRLAVFLQRPNLARQYTEVHALEPK